MKLKFLAIIFALAIFFSVGGPCLNAQTSAVNLVKITDTSKWSPSSPDPSGIEYWPAHNTLLISDGEVDEMPPYFTGVNVYETTLGGVLLRTYSTTSFSNEPTGVTINLANGHIFYSDDDDQRVYEVNIGADGVYGNADDTKTFFSTTAFGSGDPEGVAFGQGNLYISDGVGTEIYKVAPGPNGRFDGVDDVVTHFDTAVFNVTDPEGIAYNADRNTLYITGGLQSVLVETTTTGNKVVSYDISFLNSKAVAGLAYGPSSSSSSGRSIYIVDRGVDNNDNPLENDGKMYEIQVSSGLPTIAPSNTPRATVTLTVTNTPAIIPGDANLDGKVDGLDFVIWLSHYNQVTANGYREGDFNNSGKADGIDYVIWLSHVT